MFHLLLHNLDDLWLSTPFSSLSFQQLGVFTPQLLGWLCLCLNVALVLWPTSGLCGGIQHPPHSIQPHPSVLPAAAAERGLHLGFLPAVTQLALLVSLPPSFDRISHPRHWGGGKDKVPSCSLVPPI